MSLGVQEFWTAMGQRAAGFSPRGFTKSENAVPHERPRPGAPGKLAAREIHEPDGSQPAGSDTLAEEQL